MSNTLGDYMTIKQAAALIGIEPSTLNARIRKGKIKANKVGWNKFIHKDEVKRAKRVEEKNRELNNKNMEKGTR